MATLAELDAKIDELQVALDAEQEQIKSAIDGLNAVITDLQQQVVDGGTAEQRQATLDKVVAITEDLKATIPDTPPTT